MENVFDTAIDLNDFGQKELEMNEAITTTENGTFEVTLPKSNYVVEFRLLTSKDEAVLTKEVTKSATALLKLITVSINGQSDSFYIERALSVLPIADSSLLRKLYTSVMPDVDMSCDVECPRCLEVSQMEVPLTAEFFWPDF